MTREVNFDGLVGPTHNYAGLSYGNKAAMTHRGQRSNPRTAALQGLSKMRALVDLGLGQGILPPHERPYVPGLRRLGFSGRDEDVVAKAAKSAPLVFANMCSASAMWTANAATVSPSPDTKDRRIHFLPANLNAMSHRNIEYRTTERILRAVFNHKAYFKVHKALPSVSIFADEGAANHNRMSASHDEPGLEIFVYGRDGLSATQRTKFPGRQTLQASQATARLHGLDGAGSLFVEQSTKAIDAGAFHNDVVCVSNETVLLYHEHAFEDHEEVRDEIRRKSEHLGFDPIFITASTSEMPLEDAVSSYFFNSQLITCPDGLMVLVLPSDAEGVDSAKAFAEACRLGDNPIKETLFFDLRESMRNGGGPACLRLRVVLTPDQEHAVTPGVLMNHEKLNTLSHWVNTHYRDRLDPKDLGDPQLLVETRTALDELTQILSLGSLYDFQREDQLS